MRPLILAASMLATSLIGGTIAAQTPPPRPMPGPETRANAMARADQRFATIDTDKDGRITAVELAAMPRPRGPMPGMTPPPPPAGADARTPPRGGPGRGMGQRMFERADANKDGVITRDEFRAQASQMFDRQDLNKDGTVDMAERQKLREQRMERRGDRGDD
jgi:hypothetical protein